VRRVRAARIDPGSAPRSFNARWLALRLRALIGPLRGARLCVAFSGGADSMALLAALSQLRRRSNFRLRALHVDHGLQPQSAAWARQARQVGRRLQVPVRVLAVEVPRGGSLEAAAREARYAALGAALRPGEWLLTAQHLDDQLETVLLQLLRGAGLPGLAAMGERTPLAAGSLLRPLLPVARRQLLAWLQRRGLAWTEDPSNADERFDRNYLRRRITPALQARWPAAAQTARRSAAHLAEAQALLDQQADAQLALAADGAALRVPVLRRMAPPLRRQVLRRWLRTRGLPAPDQSRLQEMASALLAARADAMPRVSWPGAEVRRHGASLHAMAPLPPLPVAVDWPVKRGATLTLPGIGRLRLQPDPHGNLCLAGWPARLQVRFRGGGERLRTTAGRQPLKDVLQRAGVLPWQRARLPLLYAGDRLIAVADLWLDPQHSAAADCKRRARLLWEPHQD